MSDKCVRTNDEISMGLEDNQSPARQTANGQSNRDGIIIPGMMVQLPMTIDIIVKDSEWGPTIP